MSKWKCMIGFAALVSAQACSAAAPEPVLSALSQRDIEAGVEPGVGCDFRTGENSFLVVTIGEALIKVDGVVRHFRFDNDRSIALINFGGTFGDRVVRVLIDRHDIEVAQAEEGTVREARLTVRSKAGERTLTGRWVCGA